MSKLRPESSPSKGDNPCPRNGTAYLMILNAVEAQNELIAGRLHDHGAHCAVGSFWTVNPKVSLPTAIVDEVAMVNDSFVNVTPHQRKVRVARWLRWKLTQIGMPGFKQSTP